MNDKFTKYAGIVFLDIDGVLTSMASLELFNEHLARKFLPYSVTALNRLLTTCNLGVVISSTWRMVFKEEDLLGHMEDEGIDSIRERYLGKTPAVKLADTRRGEEIEAWLKETKYAGPFVILDDDTAMASLTKKHVLTGWEIGLAEAHVDKAIRILKEQQEKS